jgi:SAM-dependent methyltransferase
MTRAADAAVELRERAEELIERLAAVDALAVAGLSADAWAPGLLDEPFRHDPDLRREAHRGAVLALAGVVEGGADRLGHVSDWLRNHHYLYGELRPAPRAAMLARARTAGQAALDATRPRSVAGWEQVRACLDDLHRQLPAAAAAFDCLPDLNRIPDRTGAGIERYWDDSARTSPWLTIDWASFGREDLFDHNGWRAAAWLRDHGFAEPGFHVVQIGCGAGRVEKHLAGMVARVSGVDVSEEMLRLARARLGGCPNASLVKSNGWTAGLPDASADTVFSLLVFIHLHDPLMKDALVREAGRILRPRGRFVLTLQGDDPGAATAARSAGLEVVFDGRLNSRWLNSFRHRADRLLVFRRP